MLIEKLRKVDDLSLEIFEVINALCDVEVPKSFNSIKMAFIELICD